MTGAPSHCRPEALEALARVVPTLDTTESLLDGALAIAMHELEVDTEHVRATLGEWGDRILERVGSPQSGSPQARSLQARSLQCRSLLAHSHQVLFEDLGLRGNVEDYLDPANSYVPSILELRRGLPISLVLVYKVVLERVGLTVHGIGAPGHFLARVQMETGPVLTDPFGRGVPISGDEAFDRIDKALGRPIERDPSLLKRVTHHMWLYRLLNNLEICFYKAGRPEDQQAMQELKAVLYRG